MIEVKWADTAHQRVILQTVNEGWTTEAFVESVDLIAEMMKAASPAAIYLITDMSRTRIVPKDVIRRGRSIFLKQQPNMALCVIVGMHPLAMYIYEASAPLMPRLRPLMRLANTVDEAYMTIEAHATVSS
ncbi:MAG: hypothetical protein AAF125_18675 [Chloroflexota bacterium]